MMTSYVAPGVAKMIKELCNVVIFLKNNLTN